MGDAGDILGNILKKGKPRKDRSSKRPPKKKCPEGVNREVFELQRDNESEFGQSMSLLTEKPASIPFKAKRNLEQKAEKWEKKPFLNSARSDSLQLYHWDKASAPSAREYHFAKFNKEVEIFQYTDDEYKASYEDPKWTKEETDVLMDYCRRFDLRFIVIADRFKQVYPNKTIEDLRERYYSIMRKKVTSLAETDKNIKSSEVHAIKYKYNPDHERKRKEQAEKLYHRTLEEVEEEKQLMLEYKRIESYQKKQQLERKRVFQLTKSISPSQGPPPRKRRKRSDSDPKEVVATPTVNRTRPHKGTGAFIRGSRMYVPLASGTALTKKVDEALDGLGISARPIPTSFVAQEYGELRNDIATLLDLQSHMKKKEYELQSLKLQLQLALEQKQTTAP